MTCSKPLCTALSGSLSADYWSHTLDPREPAFHPPLRDGTCSLSVRVAECAALLLARVLAEMDTIPKKKIEQQVYKKQQHIYN